MLEWLPELAGMIGALWGGWSIARRRKAEAERDAEKAWTEEVRRRAGLTDDHGLGSRVGHEARAEWERETRARLERERRAK